MPEAARLAAELKKEVGLDAELIEGKNGIFEVKADDKVIYSKNVTGRFPKAGEVTALLRKASP